MMKLWIRVRYQNNTDDWMEVPIGEKESWENIVANGCIKESKNNPNEDSK